MLKEDDITPVWYCKGNLKIIPIENFKTNCTCGTKVFTESTGGCPVHGIYINNINKINK